MSTALAPIPPLPQYRPEDDFKVSFEFFPPKTPAMEQRLWETIRRLERLNPRFVTITYGAGGSTREQTFATVARILGETILTPAAHLTCVGVTREMVEQTAERYWDAGIRRIIALRGDPPDGREYVPHPDGYAYAADLVAGLKRIADFDISVAAYPEVHPRALSLTADLDNLKRKLDAGACRAITQFFFDTNAYLRFLDRVRSAGIEAPIVAGILPINDFDRAFQFATKCGVTVPRWIAELFDDCREDPTTQQLVAAAVAVEQCRYLQVRGVDEFHFYTLNRAELTVAIYRMLCTPSAGAEYSTLYAEARA